MNQKLQTHRLLYLLTAILLLMQSFAIWHDTSHQFHQHTDQCQRFESVSHTPTLSLTSSISPQFTAQFSSFEPIFTVTYASKRLRDHNAIRAPPIFS